MHANCFFPVNEEENKRKQEDEEEVEEEKNKEEEEITATVQSSTAKWQSCTCGLAEWTWQL